MTEPWQDELASIADEVEADLDRMAHGLLQADASAPDSAGEVGAGPAPETPPPAIPPEPGADAPAAHDDGPLPSLAALRAGRMAGHALAGLDPVLALAGGPEVSPSQDDPGGWSADRASRAVRALAQIARDEVKELSPYKSEIRLLSDAATAIERRYAAARARIELALERWMEKNPPPGKKRSHRFPAGTVGYRRGAPWVEVTDEQAALAWADRHLPEAINPKLRLDVLKRAIIGAREPPPGVGVHAGRDKFYVAVDLESAADTNEGEGEES